MPNNPSYTGGAVTLNSNPSTNLALQLYQKKLAREEAMDEYERNRINRINETGLRDQDREGLDNRVLDLKGYYNQYKDHIRKGNTPQSYEYEKKVRDVLGYINKSKDATAKAETFNKLRQERLKMGRSTPEEWFNDYITNENAIDDESHKPLDITKYMAQSAPKYDQQKATKLFADIKRTPGTPKYEPVPGDRFNRNEIITESFDDAAKQTIASRAHELYDSDDGFAYEVQQDYNNPLKRGQLEHVFAQEYKTAPQSLADYAVAKKIQELQPSVTKRKLVPNKEAIMDQQNKNSLARLYVYANIQDRKPETIGRNIDALIAQHIEDARANNGEVVTDNATFESITGKKKSGNSVLMFDEANNKYTYGTKDATTGEVKIVGEVPIDLGRIKLTKTYKTGLDSKYNTGKKIEPPRSTMVTVVLSDGRKGQIPADKVSQFLKDNPGSKKQ